MPAAGFVRSAMRAAKAALRLRASCFVSTPEALISESFWATLRENTNSAGRWFSRLTSGAISPSVRMPRIACNTGFQGLRTESTTEEAS